MSDDAHQALPSSSGSSSRRTPQALTRGITAVLFDLDGTLLDTADDLTAALNALRAQEALTPLAPTYVRGFVSHGSAALVRLAFPSAPQSRFDNLRERFTALYAAALAVHTHPFDGMLQVLEYLEHAAVPWGIVTNKPYALAAALLEQLGLAQRARVVLGGDTLPERKPHPRPLLYAAEQLHAEPSYTAYVGDAERDILAARAAGMQPIVAGFGYVAPGENPQAWPADAWVSSPYELLAWLRRATATRTPPGT